MPGDQASQAKVCWNTGEQERGLWIFSDFNTTYVVVKFNLWEKLAGVKIVWIKIV